MILNWFKYFNQKNQTILCVLCFEIYGLDLTHFLSTRRLLCQASLQKSKVKLDLLTSINLLIMVKKVLEVELYHVTHWYAKANDSTRNIITKIKNHHESSIGIKYYVFLIKYYHFSIKEWKLKKMKHLQPTCMIKKSNLKYILCKI